MVIYKQLTQEERYQIHAYKKVGKSNAEIARLLGRDKSTIGRELRRNAGARGYRPKQAQQKAAQRRADAAQATQFTTEVRLLVEEKLELQWSPEQIAGWLGRAHGIAISHERIYQHVLDDKRNGGLLYRNLRHGRRRRKKRYGAPDRRGRIPGRVGIEHRPRIANERRRRGDWEGDTIHGKGGTGLVTLVERKSRYTLIRRVSARTASAVNAAIKDACQKMETMLKTLTVDNGREFAGHRELKEALEVDVFFAQPYQSWQRGSNENANGLIRQYFPKGTNFDQVTDEQVAHVEMLLATRPRKCLGWLTPHQVLVESRRVRLNC